MCHKLGICQMFTAIASPDEVFTLDDIRRIAKKAETCNARIGLSDKVNSVVIRSRDVNGAGPVWKREKYPPRKSGTNPMLIINNIDKPFPTFLGFSEKAKGERLYSIFAWKKRRIEKRSYYLIHEENEEMQRASIHGRVARLADGSYEISLGTGVLHAREIGEKDHPYISMHGHDLEFMFENVKGGNLMTISGTNNFSEGKTIATTASQYIEKLHNALDLVEQVAGKGMVLEFRIYDGPAGLQVYDYDGRFGEGAVITLSKIRPSAEYEDEVASAEK
jgi:hypothetical protein